MGRLQVNISRIEAAEASLPAVANSITQVLTISTPPKKMIKQFMRPTINHNAQRTTGSTK